MLSWLYPPTNYKVIWLDTEVKMEQLASKNKSCRSPTTRDRKTGSVLEYAFAVWCEQS